MESVPHPGRRPSLASAPAVTPESDVQTELTGRFLGDSALAEFANVALGLAVTLLLVGLVPTAVLVGWFGALVAASAIRYRVRMHYARLAEPPSQIPWAVVATIVLVGLVWSAGAMPLLLGDDREMALRVMIVECGLAAAATFTFAATRTGFRVFIASIFIPLVVGLLAHGVDRSSVTSVLLVVVFAGTMIAIQSRGRGQLTRSLQLHQDLDRSRQAAEAGETAVRESEQRLFQFLESMPVGVVVMDRNWKVYFSNAAAVQMVGHWLEQRPTLDEMRGKSIAYVPGSQQPFATDRWPIARALAGESSVDQMEVLGPQGLRLMEIHGSPIRDRAGEVAYAVAVLSDLSGRQSGDSRRSAMNAVLSLTAEATSEEQLLSAVLKLLNERFSFSLAELWLHDGQSGALRRVGASRHDDSARVAAFDRASADLTFRSGEGLPGTVWKTGEPIWRKRSEHDDLTFLRNGGVVEAGLRTAVSVPVFVAGVANGALVLFTSEARDPDGPVTETLMAIGAQVGGAIGRRRAEATLRAAEERYRQLVEASTDLVWETDREGRWTFLNAATRRIYGKDPAELIGQPFTGRSSPEHAASDRDMFARLAQGAVITEYETVHRNAQDAPVVISTSAAPLRGASGEIVGYHGMIRDVGDRAAARAALRAARDAAEQAAAAKSAFLANMSHEIRTPMNGVLGVAQLLQGTQLDADQRRMVDLIATSGTALLGVINEILDFSKIEAQQLEIETVEFDLHELVESTVKLTASPADRRAVAIRTEIGADVPRFVAGDPTRLRQVLSNLLGNAIKFTHAGDVVTSVSRIAGVGKTARLSFAVSDTGIGMSPETLEGVFEPFRQADSSMTRRYGGTGLGLSISKRLVELMGGHLVVTSTEGKGSRFSFELFMSIAAAAPRAEPAGPPARPIEPSARRLAVLVAEDNPISQEVARAMLTSRGHAVDVADDGRAAVSAALRKDYDIILMDIQMPELDGLGATTEIRRLRPAPRPRIIAFTANILPGESERCLASGMDGYLAKPFTAADLFAAVENGAGPARPARTPEPAVTHAPLAQPPVDIPALRADLRSAGIEESMSVFIDLFLQHGPGRAQAITNAMNAGDVAALATTAHAMKSSAGAIRATRLLALLTETEKAAKGKDLAAAVKIGEAAVAEHQMVREWLEAQTW